MAEIEFSLLPLESRKLLIWSGSPRSLLTQGPLRTVRAIFTAYGSSRCKPSKEDRCISISASMQPIDLCNPLRVNYTSSHRWARDGRPQTRASARALPCWPALATSEVVPSGFMQSTTTQKSATVSRGVMFQPLSEPLQPGVRFFCDPLPTRPTAHLTARLPIRQQYGLTTFLTCHTPRLEPAFSPGAL